MADDLIFHCDLAIELGFRNGRLRPFQRRHVRRGMGRVEHPMLHSGWLAIDCDRGEHAGDASIADAMIHPATNAARRTCTHPRRNARR